MQKIEPITIYLKRKLKDAGAARFDAIAQAAGVNASFIRKFFYGSRENPRVQTIQPLIDYFMLIEGGDVDLVTNTKSDHINASNIDRAELVKLINAGLVRDNRQFVRRAATKQVQGA